VSFDEPWRFEKWDDSDASSGRILDSTGRDAISADCDGAMYDEPGILHAIECVNACAGLSIEQVKEWMDTARAYSNLGIVDDLEKDAKIDKAALAMWFRDYKLGENQ